jgi:hypothetical protein
MCDADVHIDWCATSKAMVVVVSTQLTWHDR